MLTVVYNYTFNIYLLGHCETTYGVLPCRYLYTNIIEAMILCIVYTFNTYIYTYITCSQVFYVNISIYVNKVAKYYATCKAP